MSQNTLRPVRGGTMTTLVAALLMPGVVSGSRPVNAAPSTTPAKRVQLRNTLPSVAKHQEIPISDQDLRSVSRLKRVVHRLVKAEEEENEQKERAYKKAVALARKQGRPIPKKKKEGSETVDYLQAYLTWLKVRAYPNDTVDLGAYRRAVAYRQTMRPFTELRTRIQTSPARMVTNGVPVPPIQWQFIGPRNLPPPYQIYYGPPASFTSGRINGLAFHPTNSQIVYLASGGGGLWKTTDGGANWNNISRTFPTQNIGKVVVDPTTPSTVYVGLGDYDGFRGTIGGIMKSIDGGVNWTVQDPTNGPLSNSFISGLAQDPDTPSRLVACAGRSSIAARIFLSTDSGATWVANALQGGAWGDLKISPLKTSGSDPKFPSTRFYYVANDGNGIWRSTDKGATWNVINDFPNQPYRYIRIAPSVTDPNVLYAVESNYALIYKGVRDPSSDTYTWTSVSSGFPNDSSPGDFYNWSQDWYDNHLTAVAQKVGGVTSDALYSGLITFAGKRGNNNWQDIGVTFTVSAQSHNDQHSFAAFPANPNIMMFGNDGGVYGLTYNDTAGTYTISNQLSSTLGVTMFYYGDFHPTNPAWAIGGSQDNATPVVTGDTGNWGNVGGGDGAGVAINPINPAYQYASIYSGGFVWTRNSWGGEGQTNMPATYTENNQTFSDGPFTPRLTIDPNYPNPVYFGGLHWLHRYNEPGTGGSGWETKLGDMNFNSQLLAISVAPSNSRILYIGTNSGLLSVSTDRGTSWRTISTGLPNRAITDIWVNPKTPTDIIAVVSGTGAHHVWRCTNTAAGSPAWSDISASGFPDIPANTITQDPFDTTGKTFYVGTDIGVFATANGGTTWSDATAPLGLPNVQVNTLKAMPGTGYLMAATYGRGMWRIPLTSALPDLVPDLRFTRTISRSNGNISVTVTMTNVGGATATAPSITLGTLKIGTLTTNTSTALPLSMTSINPGSSATATLSFPGSVGVTGTAGIFTMKSSYTYGAKTGSFSGSSRVTLP